MYFVCLYYFLHFSLLGGSQLTITGSGFSDNGTLRIGDTELPDAVFTNTTITATLPSMSQGVKKVWVFASTSNGAAVNRYTYLRSIQLIIVELNVPCNYSSVCILAKCTPIFYLFYLSLNFSIVFVVTVVRDLNFVNMSHTCQFHK